ncbi:hypothetical protein IU500_01495 [Nocardia terpenica]|uniref:N-acetylglutamate synthase n=1 Tax=Nocardia terpenica TaxID=455432 RepID=A0A161WN05_9NOCA|nr:hypothetical protein [Nocardia terpenica]ATL68604.1 hypothetical protein CRH09_22840 [Nocardia terpenica]KZM74505.1 hypothetical protein AWN90_25950 [Nocardia terpenica]MBF6059752.1 hypothetical protein [Nocardia terpenica]MBF6102707.1 hypothetical protein [Nocardia terpenica]MBF6111102.1 hypothetical protein [Nocardia terpenica]
MINYEGRRFRNPASDDGVIARYHQAGDLVWAHFSGGHVRRGSITGLVDDAGALRMAYTMVLADGEIVTGFTHSTPETDGGGPLRLREEWERYGPNSSRGTSYLEEVP